MILALVVVYYLANGRIERRNGSNLFKVTSLNKLEAGAYYIKSVLSNLSL